MAKRRGNGEGSIYQRADGQWVGTVSLGYGADGKRRRRTVYGKTKKEVQDKLAELQHQSRTGTLANASKMTVAVYLDRWLSESARVKVRGSTLESYERVVRIHIKPAIGHLALQKVTALDIESVYSAMEKAGKAPRMRQYAHAILRRSFKIAVRWKLLTVNPCDAVESPTVPRNEIKPLDSKETAQFLEAASVDRLSALYVLAITTGLRQGELLGLQWADIDLDRATLSVRRTLLFTKYGIQIGEPKTDRGRRLVTLPSIAVEALRDHRKRMVAEGWAGAEWVFCSSTGGHIWRGDLREHSLAKILKRAGLRHIRFHDLRHTAATLLLGEGVHPKVVQERLGHSTISLTMDTYSHVLPSMQSVAVEKLDKLFGNAAG